MDINKKSVFEHNKQMVSEYITVEIDEILDSTISRLSNAGVGIIKDITIDANSGGWNIHLTDEKNQVYYLELDKLGCIEILRKNNAEGEVLFVVLYD
jgi:hypothetical protein